MIEYSDKKKFQVDHDSENEIDVNSILNIFIRNKSLIFLTTLIGTILGIIYTSKQQPIYIGRFQVVVDTKKEENKIGFNNQALSNLISGQEPSSLKTQELILKSPFVLKPVYQYALTQYEMRNDKRKNWSFNKWSSTTLNIGFAKGTKILNIGFKDKDKKFILSTLEKISSEYQNYSKLSRDRNLQRGINFLSDQRIILKDKALKSMKELNKFSIDNGLGDIDGFVSLEQEENNELKNFKKDSINTSKAGQRFENQLRLLEEYELEYTDFLSILKEDSKLLKSKKLKIENLKEALKRPIEILLKYKELSKVAKRDEIILNKVEDDLIFTKLEIAKQKDPWEMIFEPTIDDLRISPKRKETTFISFLAAISLGGLLAFIKDKSSGKIYELENLKRLINCEYIDSIELSTKELSRKIVYKFLESKTKDNKKTFFVNTYIENYQNPTNILFENEKDMLIDLKENTKIENSEYLIFFINKNNITYNEINLMNKYNSIYSSKVLGWFLLEDK